MVDLEYLPAYILCSFVVGILLGWGGSSRTDSFEFRRFFLKKTKSVTDSYLRERGSGTPSCLRIEVINGGVSVSTGLTYM